MTVDEIKAELTKLSDEEREAVFDFLSASLGAEESQFDEEWVEEINRRVALAKADPSRGIPAEEAHRRLREKYS